MKNLLIFGFFVMALIFVQFASAQTVDDIINKHIDAMGGKNKLASLKSVKMEGAMSVQGTDVSITTTKSHLVGLRLDIEVMGTSNYQVVNNTKGTIFMPVQGMTEPTDMDAEQFKSSQNQLDVQGSLFNYKEKGTKVDLEGTEEVAGAPAHKLKVSFKNGKVSHYFIDSKTYRLVKVASKATINGTEMDVETNFSDFKQNADGYWFPYTVATMQGTTTYNTISTNIPVDENLFKN